MHPQTIVPECHIPSDYHSATVTGATYEFTDGEGRDVHSLSRSERGGARTCLSDEVELTIARPRILFNYERKDVHYGWASDNDSERPILEQRDGKPLNIGLVWLDVNTALNPDWGRAYRKHSG
eukprot:gene1659-biopygen7981